MLFKDTVGDVYVLVENDVAYTSDGQEPFDIQLSPDSDKETMRKALLEIKDWLGLKFYPQTITLNLRQAQAIFHVKAGRVSPEWGFNALVYLLNV